MKVDKILVTVEETSTYTFEVSPETGFDCSFPSTLEGLVNYVEQIKTNPDRFCNIENEGDLELLTEAGIVTTRKVTCID